MKLLKECWIVSDDIACCSLRVEEDPVFTASLGAVSTAALVNCDLVPSGKARVFYDAKVKSSWVSFVHVGDCLLDYRHIVSLATNFEFYAMLSAFGVSEFCHLD